mmetsp:Transcript_15117/g.64725  ORF Transcript_15117/g.64725 Transcript_15117/m.64725 type:complete len:386 (+) Transcript_15117:128-1285(+)
MAARHHERVAPVGVANLTRHRVLGFLRRRVRLLRHAARPGEHPAERRGTRHRNTLRGNIVVVVDALAGRTLRTGGTRGGPRDAILENASAELGRDVVLRIGGDVAVVRRRNRRGVGSGGRGDSGAFVTAARRRARNEKARLRAGRQSREEVLGVLERPQHSRGAARLVARRGVVLGLGVGRVERGSSHVEPLLLAFGRGRPKRRNRRDVSFPRRLNARLRPGGEVARTILDRPLSESVSRHSAQVLARHNLPASHHVADCGGDERVALGVIARVLETTRLLAPGPGVHAPRHGSVSHAVAVQVHQRLVVLVPAQRGESLRGGEHGAARVRVMVAGVKRVRDVPHGVIGAAAYRRSRRLAHTRRAHPQRRERRATRWRAIARRMAV